MIAAGSLNAATSSLVLLEVANSMRKYGLLRQVEREIKAILSLPLRLETLEPGDAKRASELFSTYRIGPYDCGHLAIMERIASKIIVSADKEFDKVKVIRRIDPLNPKVKTLLDLKGSRGKESTVEEVKRMLDEMRSQEDAEFR